MLQVTPLLVLLLAASVLEATAVPVYAVKAAMDCFNPPPTASLINGVTWSSSCASGNTTHNSVCSGSCPNTTNPTVTSPSVRCNDGTWQLTFPFMADACREACVIPAPLGDGISEYNGQGELAECMADPEFPSTPVFNAHGTLCLAECDEGYTPSDIEVTATCLDGSWVKSGFCSPPCPSQIPSSLSPNTAWTCPETISTGVTCSGRCTTGQPDAAQGAPVAVCGSNGQWSIASGRCINPPVPAGCPNPPLASLAANTLWAQCVGSAHGQQCRGTCAAGTTADASTGSPVALCSDGTWILLGGACLGSCRFIFGNAGGARSLQQPVCPEATSLEASFSYSAVDVQDLAFTATATSSAVSAAAMRCTVDSASVASTAKVTCVTANGQQVSAGASYTIRVTASYKCDNRPATAVASATMAVRKPTQASLVRQGAARLSVCTGGGPNSVSVTHKYEVVNEDAVGAADLSVSASASILGITCSAEIRKGADTIVNGTLVSTGTAVVTCNGNFRPKSNFNITTVMSAKPQGCSAVATSVNQLVAVSCCKYGVSYARPEKTGVINCFKHFYPNTTCPANAPQLHGVYSQGPGRTVLTWYDTAAQRCRGLADVGNVVMTCTNDKLASFTMTSRNVDPDAYQYVMITCDRPKRRGNGDVCPGDIDWVRIDKAASKPVIIDNKTELTFTATLPDGAACTCQNAYWTVHEGATYTGLAPRLCRN